MKYWTSYLKNYIAFNYEFSILITNENYVQRIIDLETLILNLGYEFKVFTPIYKKSNGYEFEDILEMYINDRKNQLNFNNENYITLFPFHKSSSIRENILIFGISIDGIDLNYLDTSTEITLEQHNSKDRAIETIELVNNTNILNEFYDNIYSEHRISFSIRSNSNIWLDEIEISNDINNHKIFPETPFDNRDTANLIAPKFNSFLNGIIDFVNQVSGEVKLEETSYKQITDKGILIEGILKYGK